MRKAILFLLTFIRVGFAQEIEYETKSDWKFQNWAAVGYRFDRVRFDEFSPTDSSALNSRLSIHGRSSPFLVVGNHSEFRNVLLIFRGSYGWLAHGRVNYDLPGNYGAGPLTFSQFNDGAGYSAEGLGSLSYIFHIADGPKFNFDLMPGIGYHYFHFMDFPSGIQTSPLPNGMNGYATSSFNKVLEQDWFGPYFEGRILFRFLLNTQIEFFYQFHLPNMRLVNNNEINVYLFNTSHALIQYQSQQFHSVAHGNALRTQLGGFDIRYHEGRMVTFGAHFEGAATWSHTNRYYVKRVQQDFIANPETTTLITVDRMAIRWVNYMTYAYLGFRF